MQSDTGNLFSIVGIGIVVLITAYLLIDSIRSGINHRMEDVKQYLDQIYKEETEKSSERFTEANNIHKATYTALKKSSAQMSQRSEEMMDRLESLEHNLSRALMTMTELQRKTMEGQKNALNYEIHYNKENTKQLIQVLRKENNREEVEALLTSLLNSMERNNKLLESQLSSLKNSSLAVPPEAMEQKEANTSDVIEINWNDIAEQEAETLTTTEWDDEANQPVVDNLTETGWDVDAELMLESITDGWEVSEVTADSAVNVSDDQEIGAEVEAAEEETAADNWSGIGDELNGLIGSWDTEDNAPDAETDKAEGSEPEAVQLTEEKINSSEVVAAEQSKPTITPLYSDPNKNLSADEIAALFASFGQ